MRLETERLVIRHWEVLEAEEMFKYASDPDVGPSCGWPPHKTVETSIEIIKAHACLTEYGLELKETGKPIGCLGIKFGNRCGSPARNTTDEAELGCWIGKPYWGKGLMPEAVREVLRYLFEEQNVKAVWWGYFAGNEKSKRCAEKCGFKYQFTQKDRVKYDGSTTDEDYLKITREEWEQMKLKGRA